MGVLKGEDRRKFHQRRGERIRVWQSYLAPEGATGPNGELREANGRIYVEQPLKDGVRALIWNGQKQVQTEQWGVITVGTTMISVMPDEIHLARSYRVLPLWPNRAQIGQCLLVAGVSQLPQRWASAINRVLCNGNEVGDYQLDVNDSDGTSRLLNLPASTCSVEFKYQPVYVWNDLENRSAPMGSDGVPLPQIGELVQETGP